mgnify:CR=1 FL=1
MGLPDSLGVTENVAKDTLIARYNDIDSVEKILIENRDAIASIIVEPVAGNMGLVLPKNNFLNDKKLIIEKEKNKFFNTSMDFEPAFDFF